MVILKTIAAMMKEMYPSHCIDVLSDALLYYCQKSARKLYIHTHDHIVIF